MKIKKTTQKLRFTHKWIGLLATFFIIMFSLSGIFLNHRQAIAAIDVPRSILPQEYRYNNWNNGAVKGTIKLSPDSILLYGGCGMWLTDSLHSHFSEYSVGMKTGVDNKSITNIVRTNRGEIFATTTFHLYKLDLKNNQWLHFTKTVAIDERIADMTTQSDLLIVMTRSHVYVSEYPYSGFHKVELPIPLNYNKEVTLFKMFWTLHSGELFGYGGRLFVDLIGIVTIVLCLTGIIIFFFPTLIRRSKQKINKSRFVHFFKTNLKWHNKLGAWFLILSLITILTGVFLRPPLLMFVVRDKVAPISGTVLNSSNPWFDKLRNIRYDAYEDDWVLYTSDGFYQMKNLFSIPTKIKNAPRTSVMGINILEQTHPGLWVVGSFSGLYYWDKSGGKHVDAMQIYPAFIDGQRIGGSLDASGYSNDFAGKELVFSYSSGAISLQSDTGFAPMPTAIQDGDMSLWHLSLEVHVGRIYNNIFGDNADSFILYSGVTMVFIYLSGYIVYRRVYKRKKKKLAN